MSDITQSTVWKKLKRHQKNVARLQLKELFQQDQRRFERFSVVFDDLLFDYSKQLVTPNTMKLLLELARQAGLEEWRTKLFSGERINHTEGRAVLHTALRRLSAQAVTLDGRDIMPEVRRVREKTGRFAEAVRSGEWRGSTGKPLTQIVNIGIGGSDLGPRLAAEALRPYWQKGLRGHFVSNVDGADLSLVLEELDPESALFIVSSKTFTTLETLTNARSARSWLTARLGEAAVRNHFVAVSTNAREVAAFGIDPENMFEFWDWVGGRYSVWSAIGLLLEILIGRENFEKFLAGAEAADRHFLGQPAERNIPILMALLGVWYVNFWGLQTHAILPYDRRLRLLPAYLQQAEMESNGKSVDRLGRPVNYQTSPVVWGGAGTDSQHSFFQLLHQGTAVTPADFIAACESDYPLDGGRHHRLLLANCFAQSEALMLGKTAQEARQEMLRAGVDPKRTEFLLPYRTFPGNRPSSSFLFKRLDPFSLGRLLALYEHKIFVQGVIWNINSYDQFGVELGKQLAGRLAEELESGHPDTVHDSSTRGLAAHYLRLTGKCQSA